MTILNIITIFSLIFLIRYLKLNPKQILAEKKEKLILNFRDENIKRSYDMRFIFKYNNLNNELLKTSNFELYDNSLFEENVIRELPRGDYTYDPNHRFLIDLPNIADKNTSIQVICFLDYMQNTYNNDLSTNKMSFTLKVKSTDEHLLKILWDMIFSSKKISFDICKNPTLVMLIEENSSDSFLITFPNRKLDIDINEFL